MSELSHSPQALAWGYGGLSTGEPFQRFTQCALTPMKPRREAWLVQSRKPLKRFLNIGSYVNPKLKLGENESFASGPSACRVGTKKLLSRSSDKTDAYRTLIREIQNATVKAYLFITVGFDARR